MYKVLSVPISYVGIISMIVAGGTVISSFLSARFIKRFGTGKVTLISVAITAFALIRFGLSHSFIFLPKNGVCLVFPRRTRRNF
jgi:MFS family permease